MVSYEELGEILTREAQERAVGLSAEVVSPINAVGRVVWSDVKTERAVPDREQSLVDGYAILAGCAENASSEEPVWFRVVDHLESGGAPDGIPLARPVTMGQGLQGGDAVVGRHEVMEEGGSIAVCRPIRLGEGVRTSGSERERDVVLIRKGEPFTVVDQVAATVAGVSDVLVCPRLMLGLIVVGNGAPAPVESYASIIGLVAGDMGVVLSEVVQVDAADHDLCVQIQRLVSLELDCIVVVSSTREQVRSAVETSGGWILFDSAAAYPLADAFFGTFRGHRSVVFSVQTPLVPFIASLRFLVSPYVARVAGMRQRSPIKAPLAHLVEKPSEGYVIVPGELEARRGEFLVHVNQAAMPSLEPFARSPFLGSLNYSASDPLSVIPLDRASCWVVLPAGKQIMDRGDLVDVETLMPHVSRRSLVQTPQLPVEEGDPTI